MRLPDTQSTFSLQRAVFHREPRQPSSIPVSPQLSSSSGDVKSESEWQFPCSADAKKKGRPIKSPDIKSPPCEFTAGGSRLRLITGVSCLLHQELIQSF